MFGWLGPRCPLDTGEKMWTEYRMRWLAGKLGLDRLVRSEVILPEPRFFPDPFSGTPDDARRIFDRVCGYMKLDPGRFDLEVVPDDSIQGAAGLYDGGERPTVVVAHSRLSDPERLVATIAHELAHDILLGGGLITTREEDHEHLTDLLPVYLGLGLFAANAPVRDRSYNVTNWHHFKIDRQGYLPSRMIGYALALFAYVRGESKPSWARHLRPDAAQPLKQGLSYLIKTGDSLFHPDTAHRPVEPPTEAQIIERLATGSPTVRAMTLYDVADLNPPPVGLVDAVAGRLRDRDAQVRLEAARILPMFGEAASVVLLDLIQCLGSDSAALRAHAAAALPMIGGPPDEVVPELTRLLQDSDPTVVNTAAAGLGRLAPAAASAIPALVEAMRICEINCQSSETLAAVVVTIDPPAEVLQRLLDPINPEIRRLVTRSLRTARSLRDDDRAGPAEIEFPLRSAHPPA